MNKNILICSAGRRVSLVTYFQEQAASLLGSDAKVLATDLDTGMSPACRVADIAETVGRFTDDNYIDSILQLCEKHRIAMVIPTIDTELLLLANSKQRFIDNGIKLIVSTPDFVATCRNKNNTNQLFETLGFHTPQPIDINLPDFPFFAKPVSGSSSKDIFLVKNRDYLSNYISNAEKFIHQEYLPPERFEEYTVDLYYDSESMLRCAVPRLRIATRGGEIAKGMTSKNRVFYFVLDALSKLTGAVGCITLQVFLERDSDKVYGIEINARFGGGYPLSYLAGANYPRMLIEEHLLGKKIEYFDAWEEGLVLLRYDHEMVVHATRCQ